MKIHTKMKNFRFGLLVLLLLSANINAESVFFGRLADSAITLAKQSVVYDPTYYKIPYPNGDVPAGKGVCTDVIIRAYRKLGVDLQKEVHEDMQAHFSLYPKVWGMIHTDKNIDHRRVPNLMTFFGRKGTTKPKSSDSKDYLPGDIVCWNLGGSVTHIGIVVKTKTSDGKRYKMIHNIGAGQVVEDCLFSYTIIGHYSYQK